MLSAKLLTLAAVLAAGLTTTTCNKTMFSGKSNKSKSEPGNNIILLDARGLDNKENAGTGNAKENDIVNVMITASGTFNNEEAVVKNVPIDLVFVIDSSLSMADEIEAVRATATNLVQELKNKNIDLNVGAIGFIDTLASIEERSVNLTGDISAFTSDFQSKLTLATLYNADMPEASQLAARKGLSLLSTGRRQAIKAMILITDVVGHNGHPKQIWEGEEDIDESKTDCTTTALVKETNDFLASGAFLPSMYKFYYLVPNVSSTVPDSIDRYNAEHKCESNGLDINTQMDEVIAGINTSVSASNRGGSLGELNGLEKWPFDGASLTQALLPLLSTEVTQIVGETCYAKNVKVSRDAKPEYEWKATSLDELIKVSNNEILIPKVSTLKGMTADEKININIQRCCFAPGTASPSLDACGHDYMQTISFMIKKS